MLHGVFVRINCPIYFSAPALFLMVNIFYILTVYFSYKTTSIIQNTLTSKVVLYL